VYYKDKGNTAQEDYKSNGTHLAIFLVVENSECGIGPSLFDKDN
jgi:hypothetical protein